MLSKLCTYFFIVKHVDNVSDFFGFYDALSTAGFYGVRKIYVET